MVAFWKGKTESQPGINPNSADEDIRSAAARRLVELDGIDPDKLIPNSLDEEPIDGMLPIGGPAHFAWRERLHVVPK